MRAGRSERKLRKVKRGASGKPYRIVWDERGIPCPRCSNATQIREHRQLSEKHLQQQSYYYRRWFYCVNKGCPTKHVMCEEFKVMNAGRAAPSEAQAPAQPLPQWA